MNAETDTQPPGSTSGTGHQITFFNQGLQRWMEQRAAWTREPEGYRKPARKRTSTPVLSMELLQSRDRFPKPVLLKDLIDYLVDVWEEEDY